MADYVALASLAPARNKPARCLTHVSGPIVRAEYWDVLQGGWLLGDHQIGITERGQRARRDVAGQLRVPPNLSSHRLGWQAEDAHECPPHSFAIRKAGLPRDGLDGMPTV